MKGVFVTGTDTEDGKTLFSAALLLRLSADGVRAAACKPVSAGCRRENGRLVNGDAELLAATAPVARPLEVVNPVALEPPIAPHIAAAEAGVSLRALALADLARGARSDLSLPTGSDLPLPDARRVEEAVDLAAQGVVPLGGGTRLLASARELPNVLDLVGLGL